MAKAQVKPESTKGPSWLEEVKRDAERITLKRMKDAEEEKAYEQSKKTKSSKGEEVA